MPDKDVLMYAKKEPAKKAEEYDLVTGWRKYLNLHWKEVKQRLNRRNRRRVRQELVNWEREDWQDE